MESDGSTACVCVCRCARVCVRTRDRGAAAAGAAAAAPHASPLAARLNCLSALSLPWTSASRMLGPYSLPLLG